MKKKFPKEVFVSGIGTGVGKTLVSAILVKALKADYWKPIQAGNLKNSDTILVQSLVSNSKSVFHPESYRLKLAASPHFAAEKEGRVIEINQIKKPRTKNILVIEGAGGLMVPFNRHGNMMDLIRKFRAPVILVCRNYLGSINHSLLSMEILNQEKSEIGFLGIIFNGANYNDNEEIIEFNSTVPTLARIAEAKKVDPKFVSEQAAILRSSLSLLFDL